MNVFEAIRKGDLAELAGLLAADPSSAAARDKNGISAVLQARYHHRPDMVEAIVACSPPLDLFDAVAAGNTTRVAELLGLDPRIVRDWTADGFQALHLAVYFGQANAARILMEHGADPESVAKNPNQIRPIHAAAASGSLEALLRVVHRDVDLDARQQGGFTALHAAAVAGHAGMVKLLLARGADRTLANDASQTAADLAREKGHGEVLGLLEG